MQFDTIESATDAQGVCTVWLNRPEKHNALSAKMIDELTEMALEDPSCGGNPVAMTRENTRALFDACM